MAKFFEFAQNNSGGSFDISKGRGIGPIVWIEAECPDDANGRAKQLGIYFDGVEKGDDCACCGDRWYACRRSDKGSEKPDISEKYDFSWHDTVYVHRLDGSIERVKGKSKYAP